MYLALPAPCSLTSGPPSRSSRTASTSALHCSAWPWLPEGTYEFIKHKIVVADGAVRLENGTLAGSALTMYRAVRNMVTLAGCTWSEAVRMATLTPARITGLHERKGQIVPGAGADLVALDADGLVQAVWTRGQCAYRRDQDVDLTDL
jgi:N-acetylglucosamine-6-phosphate deacetylase